MDAEFESFEYHASPEVQRDFYGPQQSHHNTREIEGLDSLYSLSATCHKYDTDITVRLGATKTARMSRHRHQINSNERK